GAAAAGGAAGAYLANQFGASEGWGPPHTTSGRTRPRARGRLLRVLRAHIGPPREGGATTRPPTIWPRPAPVGSMTTRPPTTWPNFEAPIGSPRENRVVHRRTRRGPCASTPGTGPTTARTRRAR